MSYDELDPIDQMAFAMMGFTPDEVVYIINKIEEFETEENSNE